jgi:hypothetical protein
MTRRGMRGRTSISFNARNKEDSTHKNEKKQTDNPHKRPFALEKIAFFTKHRDFTKHTGQPSSLFLFLRRGEGAQQTRISTVILEFLPNSN